MEWPIVYVPAENGYVADRWFQILVVAILILISVMISVHWNLDTYWSGVVGITFIFIAMIFVIFTSGGGP